MFPLPANATRIRYLESTGTQWVDTGVHLNASSEFSARLSVTASGTQFIFGAYANTNNQFATAAASSGKWIFDCGTNRVSSSSTVQVGSIVTMEAKNRTLYIDGVSQGTSSATPGLTGATALLFGWDRTALDGTKQGGKVRIYSASVTGADGTRDYIPVRVGTVGYLYDRANPTGGPLGNGLYGSATSTPLVAGPDTNGG